MTMYTWLNKIPMTANHRRRLLGGMVLVLLTVIAGEGLLRWFPQHLPSEWQIRLHERTRKHRTVPDAELGFLLQPNQRQLVRNHDFTYLVQTDAKGFPNREPWPEKVDVLFLGDSLVTGEGVGIDGAFPSLVARALPGTTILNLGLPGAGPERMLRVYRRFGTSRQPALVMACVYLASDLNNALHFRTWLQEGQDHDYDRFRLRFGRRFNSRFPFSPPRMLKKSLLYAVVKDFLLYESGRQNGFRGRVRLSEGTDVFLDKRKLHLLTQEIRPQDTRIDFIVDSLVRLRSFASTQQATLLVVLLPSKEEIMTAATLPEVLTAVRTVRQRLKAEQLAFVDLYDSVREHSRHGFPYYPRDSHLNSYGNRIVADRLVDWLRQYNPLTP